MKISRILAVVKARNREFYRDKAGLGWNIVMPFVFVFGFAFIFSGSEESSYTVGLIGKADIAFLETKYIRFVTIEDEAEGIEKVRRHRIDMLLDVRGQPRYWVNEFSSQGYLVEKLLKQSYQQNPAELKREQVSGRPIRYVDWVLPGILSMNLMFSSLWGVGWVIVRYRKNGVLRRLSATPLTASEFLAAQIFSRLLVVIGVTLIVYIGADILLDFTMYGSYLALALVFLAGSVSLISLGLTVASRVKSEELADGILNLISWPMMVLSGVWFSLEGTNIWAQRIAEILPLTHMVNAARRVMLDGAGVTDVLFEVGLLLAIGIVLLSLSAKTFRWQ